MPRARFISLPEVGPLIADNAVVSVSSSSGLACPDATLKAIGDHYRQTDRPRGLTSIHPIAAGDMYGIGGVDHLAQPGLLRRVVAGSLPSGPSSMASPEIWKMIIEDRIEAYNLPSGIIFHMHREGAARRPGVLSKVGLNTFVDPRLQGGAMNQSTPKDYVQLTEFRGDEWLFYPAISPDVAIIRGTTADERGNISMENEGAYLGALDQAIAARNAGGIIIAQVKRLCANGTLKPQTVKIPGMLVDYVVVDPEQKQTTQTAYDPAISGEIFRPESSFKETEWGLDKVIARRAAMELVQDDAVNLGFGISALVPRVLLEEGLHGEVTWVIEQGPVGGMPLLGFAFGCASNADAIMASPDQFTYFQGGGFDRSYLSFLQVDAEGNVNVSRLASRPHVTAGAGGFIDITAQARAIVFCGYFTAGGLDQQIEASQLRIRKEGKSRKFVEQVEHVTFSGKRARQQGQEVLFVTERAVLKLQQEGLTVIEIAPGIDLDRDVLQQADTKLRVSQNLKVMDPELFEPKKLGLRLRRRYR
jgi:propionate CoA-transferase